VGAGMTLCYGLNTPTGYQTTQSSTEDCNDADASVHVSGQFYIDADHDGYGTGILQTVCYSGSGITHGLFLQQHRLR